MHADASVMSDTNRSIFYIMLQASAIKKSDIDFIDSLVNAGYSTMYRFEVAVKYWQQCSHWQAATSVHKEQ